MTERIQDKLGIPVEATTVHKLGLDIIKMQTDSALKLQMKMCLIGFLCRHVGTTMLKKII